MNMSTRRSAVGLLLLGTRLQAAMPVSVAAAVEAAHAEVWRRFIEPNYFTFLDYVGLDGRVPIPSAAQCAQDQPNALGWWSPLENGAFFGGLYLDGLSNRWKLLRTRKAAEDARKIASGLRKLAIIGENPGFIARGVCDDGKGHYAAGSDDQSFPWFYGLWRYLKSGIPGEAETREIVALMTVKATAIERNGWRMPCDRADWGPRGSWMGSGFVPSARLLFVTRAMYDLTRDPRWLQLYRDYLRGRAQGSPLTRLEWIAAGIPYDAPGIKTKIDSWTFWISASSQGAVRALEQMEEEPTTRSEFRKGLLASADAAAEHIQRAFHYSNDNRLTFEPDWRRLNAIWHEQKTIDEAVDLGMNQQRKIWDRMSPRRVYEVYAMREPLFAAWVVTLSGDRNRVTAASQDIRKALLHYRWSSLNTALFFIAECAYYEGIQYGL